MSLCTTGRLGRNLRDTYLERHLLRLHDLLLFPWFDKTQSLFPQVGVDFKS